MAKFITGKELEEAVYNIIWDAEQTLLIVSPFIRLDDYFKSLFDKHINNPKVHFIVVFGKNASAVSKSLSETDFDYFKKFLNISIVYVPNLHAKYYSNEKKGVITSINLYDYSFKHNIEFGVFSETTLLNSFKNTADHEAWKTSCRIAETHEAVFIRRPVYERKMLSTLLGKRYIKSDILHDTTEDFYSELDLVKSASSMKSMKHFPAELELGSSGRVRPGREQFEPQAMGYCIRTGERIPFNPKRPISERAYRSWAQFKNPNYPENYCHRTGRPSNGKTSVSRPIL